MSDLVLEAFPQIKHLSPSNLNSWCGEYGDEGKWCLSYIYGNKFKGNTASVRGQVIEDCFLRILLKKDEGIENLLKFAQDTFILKLSDLDVDEKDFNKEYEALNGFLEQSYRAIQELQLKLPDTTSPTQLEVRYRITDKVPLEVKGFIDFDFSDYALDLKTTHKIPRKGVAPNHKRQISFYANGRKERVAKILYLSAKDYQFYALYDREIDAAYDELVFRAESLYNRLEAAAILSKHRGTSPNEELTKLVTPDMSGWSWKEEDLMFAAENNLWGMKNNK